eukprot:3381131-Amphidinium_carterae.1
MLLNGQIVSKPKSASKQSVVLATTPSAPLKNHQAFSVETKRTRAEHMWKTETCSCHNSPDWLALMR